MALKLPIIRPISDLARDAKALVAQARAEREPVVITQRGRAVAVLLPVELYHDLQRRSARMLSPRLVDPDDAAAFKMTVERVDAA